MQLADGLQITHLPVGDWDNKSLRRGVLRPALSSLQHVLLIGPAREEVRAESSVVRIRVASNFEM